MEGENGERLDSSYFHSCNRGKRSIAVDFEEAEGRAIVRRLAERSDVLVENFKTGGLAKYGLDYESLRSVNPRLVYCSITGFGHDGPYASRAGYDFIVQGMGGAMDLTGEADGEPQKPGYAAADIFTGVYAVIAIQAALARRAVTGLGGEIDMALLDTQVSVLANQALNYLASGHTPRRMGNAHPNLVPYQVFQAADGPLIVATGNDRQCWDFCRVIGRDDLSADSRYRSNADRIRNRSAFIAELAEAVGRMPRVKLLEALEAAAVPAGPIYTVAETFDDPQVIARKMRIDLPSSGVGGGSAPSVRSPIRLDGEDFAAAFGAPKLGEHTSEILGELGLGATEIAELKANAIVG
jgi:crotonobetainyl-CoA:carnitine CoA-transferase CaiB-like acyl-CoA transferase